MGNSQVQPQIFEDFQLVVASVNGSGTLTANRILHKALFRQGYHVVGKNLFPSNIEGLPTYYFLRISKGFNSIKSGNELYIGLNPATYTRDLNTLVDQTSSFLLNSDLKLQPPLISDLRTQPTLASDSKLHQPSVQGASIPSAFFEMSFRKTVAESKASVKIKKRMSNMSYVGWVGKYLGLDQDILIDVIKSQFNSSSIAEENIHVMLEGWKACTEANASIQLSANLLSVGSDDQFKSIADIAQNQTNTETISPLASGAKILIEGNQASALGWVDGGCTVATWYPITPSTSLVESFETYAKSLRPNPNSVAVLQSEDEISAIASVVGAGWAGARAATATSGPGLSLMSEALGLAYFAEVPVVVCDVQRLGPSTGLPTRTSQGDLEFAYKISHGDTFHPVLLPGDPKECYEMSAQAFDLADKYQTPIFVLSDLDLGMNLWTSESFAQSQRPFDRTQIVDEIELEKMTSEGQKFKRYLGDEFGVPRRTLPGTHHPSAAYFTRGSGHNESSGYSEHPEDYERLMLRLKEKILNAHVDLPKPKIRLSETTGSKFGAMFFGSTTQLFPELSTLLKVPMDLCQVRSLPVHEEVFEFIESHDYVFVIEQNRDGQLKNILFEGHSYRKNPNLISIASFDGWSIQADKIAEKINAFLGRVL